MKYSLPVKTIALILATVGIFAAICGGLGLLSIAEYGLDRNEPDDLVRQWVESATYELSNYLAREYIRANLANADDNWMMYSYYFGTTANDYYDFFNSSLGKTDWSYRLLDASTQNVLASGGAAEAAGDDDASRTTYTHTMSMSYPRLIAAVPSSAQDDDTSYTVPTSETTDTPPKVYDDCYHWYNPQEDLYYDYYFKWLESPVYTVQITVPTTFQADFPSQNLVLLTALITYQAYFPIALWVGLAIFAISSVYLVLAAGRKPGEPEIRPGGLNRLPLDLYTLAALGIIGVLLAICSELFRFYADVSLTLGFVPILFACLVGVAYCYAVAAQLKTKGGYWWRNSLTGRVLLWAGRFCRKCLRSGRRMYEMLPCMWQWMAVAGVLGLVLLFTGLTNPLLFLLALIAWGAIAAYGAYAFGVILEGAKRMAKGNLNTKINTTKLRFCFDDCARQLNALADVAVEAAQNQMKSDRMKTELITNVSHDIKTPLTSIINYVDLLQKPHTPEEGEQYLAVLSRQSQKMKQLIEDLMEMSKAATGNLAVDITTMDVTEAVNQALGEFADKLTAVPLTPVFHQPETPVLIQADGRLVWRTLSNLLQNAVKYALPGTRLYVEVSRVDDRVIISLKNISREELNISADELMERFVRGDASRNTEGSGLGLNIAKSLMELQHGQLRLLVDGDLFKVSLIFPGETA